MTEFEDSIVRLEVSEDFKLDVYFEQRREMVNMLYGRLLSENENKYNQGKLELAQKEKDDYIRYIEEKNDVNELLSNLKIGDDPQKIKNRHIINTECYDGKKAENIKAEQELMADYMEELKNIKKNKSDSDRVYDMLKNPELSITQEEVKKLKDEYDDEEFEIALVDFLKKKYTKCEGCGEYFEGMSGPVKCEGCEKVLLHENKQYCYDCFDKIADNDTSVCRYGEREFYCNSDCIPEEGNPNGASDEQMLEILKNALARRDVPYTE